MEVKKGDKIKFLNESGGGIIIRIIDNRQALVQIEDGFEIPMLISNLVKTESTGERSSTPAPERKGIQQVKIEPERPAKTIQEVQVPREAEPLKVKTAPKPLLAFVPVTQKKNNENPEFELYLLNDGEYYLYYIVATEKLGTLRLYEKGDLEPEMKVSLGTFALHELLKINSFVIDFLVYKEREYQMQLPVHFNLNMKSINLLKENIFKPNDFFYENALIFDCTPLETLAEQVEKKIIIKDQLEKKPAVAPEKPSDIEEIDLHIEEIMDDFSHMAPGEILNVQMARFSTALEGAQKSKTTRRIVFIHGVGNGKLKFELRKTLDNKYPHLKYQDASFAEYGFGATMVIIR